MVYWENYMITTKSRYALRALVELAVEYGSGPIPVEEMAADETLSKKYLATVMGLLKTAGFVNGIRGPGGGYVLAKHPSRITVLDIVRELDGTDIGVPCVDQPGVCEQESRCETKVVWDALRDSMTDTLRQFSLADLVRHTNIRREKAEGGMSDV